MHYVHAAFDPPAVGLSNRLRVAWNHKRYVAEERQALDRARLVICNSNRTADDVVRLAGVARDRTQGRLLRHRSGDVRAASRPRSATPRRRRLDLPPARRLALFVGALGDRRKGFDTVFDAWRTLCGRTEWDVDLVVAGTGAELEAWKARAARELPEGRVRFLGFRRDMPAVFAACDLLIHPARYEAYGLAVHEALCRGLPALVSASAGVAERYPADLGQLLLQDPASATELTARLSAWREDEGIAERVAEFAREAACPHLGSHGAGDRGAGGAETGLANGVTGRRRRRVTGSTRRNEDERRRTKSVRSSSLSPTVAPRFARGVLSECRDLEHEAHSHRVRDPGTLSTRLAGRMAGDATGSSSWRMLLPNLRRPFDFLQSSSCVFVALRFFVLNPLPSSPPLHDLIRQTLNSASRSPSTRPDPAGSAAAAARTRFHQAVLEFSAWREQDPELAAYTGEKIWLWRCEACGFAQPDRIPALPRFFERMYDQRWSPEWVAQEFDSTYKDLIFRRILETLGDRVRSTPRTLLDVGCHAGRFLQLAGEAGWRAEGTEINERTAAHAAARTGVPVHRLSAERLPELGRQFNAVTLTDVLEHIPEPVTLLSIVRRVVADGGWVAIKVPCGPAQLLKETWRARLSRGLSGHARRQPRAHQPLFTARPSRSRSSGRALTRSPWRLPRPSARRARELRRSFGSRCTTSAGACPVESTRRSRCICRRSRAPERRRGRRVHGDDRLPSRSLSVVIPTYNNEAVLRRCLTSWQRSAAACGVEIIVIEDGCRDGTRAFLESESQSAWGQRHLRWIHLDDAHELRCTNAGLVGRARAADDGLAGRHVRHRRLARRRAAGHLPRP